MNAGPPRAVLLAGFALLCAAGCVTPHTPAVWVGASFSELRQAFGDPAAILINARNNRIYAFALGEPDSGTRTTPLLYGDGELALTDTDCIVLFELAAKSVTSWDWQGDGCAGQQLPLPYQYR